MPSGATRGDRGLPGEGEGRVVPLLQVDGVHTYCGNIEALKGISLTVEQGEIVTLIGSNGAGKTTTLRTISGVLRPRQGSVRMGDQDLTKIPANEVVRLGIAHSPEGRRIFARMSVKENLEMGAYARRDSDLGSDYERVYTLFPRIKERLKQRAGTLSGGEQQMLAIGRALMARPTLLLRSEEHTSELQSQSNLVCRLLLEKKNHTPDTSTLICLVTKV